MNQEAIAGDARSPTCSDVCHPVPDQQRPVQRDAKLLLRLQNHARSRLAHGRIDLVPANTVLRVGRAEIDLVNPSFLLVKHIAHPCGQRMEVILRVETPPNAGLIRDYEYGMPQFTCGATYIEDARDKTEVLFSADITMVNIDHSIAIKKQGWTADHRQTPDNSVCARA